MYGIARLEWSTRHEDASRYWWISVDLTNKSVTSLLCTLIASTFRKIICKFDCGMEAICMRNKLMEIIFTVCPDDKDIIYISPPYKGFKLIWLQKSFLSICHEQNGVGRPFFFANCCTFFCIKKRLLCSKILFFNTHSLTPLKILLMEFFLPFYQRLFS